MYDSMKCNGYVYHPTNGTSVDLECTYDDNGEVLNYKVLVIWDEDGENTIDAITYDLSWLTIDYLNDNLYKWTIMSNEEIKANIDLLKFSPYDTCIDICSKHNVPFDAIEQLVNLIQEAQMREFYIATYTTARILMSNDEFNRIYKDELIEKVNKYSKPKNQNQSKWATFKQNKHQ